MCFQETDGGLEIVVRERVRAHDAKAVARVIRVQKMDLVVDRIASKIMCHGNYGRSREMVQLYETR
jgi:hypothetical protein